MLKFNRNKKDRAFLIFEVFLYGLITAAIILIIIF